MFFTELPWFTSLVNSRVHPLPAGHAEPGVGCRLTKSGVPQGPAAAQGYSPPPWWPPGLELLADLRDVFRLHINLEGSASYICSLTALTTMICLWRTLLDTFPTSQYAEKLIKLRNQQSDIIFSCQETDCWRVGEREEHDGTCITLGRKDQSVTSRILHTGHCKK